MKNVLLWVSVITGLAVAGGCAEREPRFPVWEANRQAIMTASPPPVPADAPTRMAENAYRTCLVRAARYVDTGSADVASLASLITPMCYPQFSEFEAAAESGFSDRDRRAFNFSGDRRQIDRASEAIRTERSQAAASAGNAPALEHPSRNRD